MQSVLPEAIRYLPAEKPQPCPWHNGKSRRDYQSANWNKLLNDIAVEEYEKWKSSTLNAVNSIKVEQYESSKEKDEVTPRESRKELTQWSDSH